jgi:hypothetical protein
VKRRTFAVIWSSHDGESGLVKTSMSVGDARVTVWNGRGDYGAKQDRARRFNNWARRSKPGDVLMLDGLYAVVREGGPSHG